MTISYCKFIILWNATWGCQSTSGTLPAMLRSLIDGSQNVVWHLKVRFHRFMKIAVTVIDCHRPIDDQSINHNYPHIGYYWTDRWRWILQLKISHPLAINWLSISNHGSQPGQCKNRSLSRKFGRYPKSEYACIVSVMIDLLLVKKFYLTARFSHLVFLLIISAVETAMKINQRKKCSKCWFDTKVFFPKQD